LISDGLADVQFNERWVEINLSSQMLFVSGEARLGQPALRALRDLSKSLRTLPNVINVEGYTDDKPIRTEAYPSNWELSSARAASVVHYLARLGVDPSRLAAVGFGEHRPRADNTTEEGRAKNRRIAILIMADGGSRDRPAPPKSAQGVTDRGVTP
jgi:chemotaxis protein MotB